MIIIIVESSIIESSNLLSFIHFLLKCFSSYNYKHTYIFSHTTIIQTRVKIRQPVHNTPSPVTQVKTIRPKGTGQVEHTHGRNNKCILKL